MNDNDLQSALSKLLSDPEAMSGIMNAASTLFGAANAAEGEASSATTVEASATHADDGSRSLQRASSGGLDLTALVGLLGGAQNNDPRCNLLYALRPFLSHERAEKIDELVKALKLASVAEKLLSKDGIM